MSGDVTIDRLVLELPGVDAAAARTVALGIAEGLLVGGIEGDHEVLSADVDPAVAAEPRRLAAEIVQILLQRIG
jgi:hypothetical protein